MTRAVVAAPRRFAAVVVFVVSAAACGGGGSSNGGSPPTVYETPPAQTVAVPSSSMEPTLHCAAPGSGCEGNIADDVVVEATDGSKVKRGDIVVFTAPPQAEQRCGSGGTFIKRVIALPGETWEERNGDVYINGKKLSESYVTATARDTASSYPSRRISAGSVFVMGDNRTQSCDSREYGPVPFANISGRVAKIIRHS